MIRRLNHQEDNIHTKRYNPIRYEVILAELKGEIDKTTIVGDFNNPLSIMNRTSRQKINKEMEDLNNTKPTSSNRHLTDIYITVHLITAEYIFFSRTYEMI